MVVVVRRGRARWVYLDAGVFTGLVETLDEAIGYAARPAPYRPAHRAGGARCWSTCDSTDVLDQRVPVQPPLALAEGDTVRTARSRYTTWPT